MKNGNKNNEIQFILSCDNSLIQFLAHPGLRLVHHLQFNSQIHADLSRLKFSKDPNGSLGAKMVAHFGNARPL